MNTILLVKENRQMLGDKNLSTYKRIKDLGNVILLDPYLHPSNTLKLVDAVISISGTVILEAILFGIKNLSILGLPEYIELIPNEYREYMGINNMIYDLKNNISPKESNQTIQEYLEKILSWGIEWDQEKQLYIKYGVGRDIKNLKYNNIVGDEIGKLIINKLIKI